MGGSTVYTASFCQRRFCHTSHQLEALRMDAGYNNCASVWKRGATYLNIGASPSAARLHVLVSDCHVPCLLILLVVSSTSRAVAPQAQGCFCSLRLHPVRIRFLIIVSCRCAVLRSWISFGGVVQ